jgi:branched-subunit amino acid aminotransferase/4-amino-4-deoxychorismate lyase
VALRADVVHALARPRHPRRRDRAVLLEAAPAAGYGVEEGAYPLDDLLGAEEALTSSSVREVMPVVAVDRRTFERGPAAATLQRALRKLAQR